MSTDDNFRPIEIFRAILVFLCDLMSVIFPELYRSAMPKSQKVKMIADISLSSWVW